jgi:cytochrome c-type biogenesis protein CcmE
MKAKHIFALVVALVFVGVAAYALIDNKIDYADFSHAQGSGKRAQISGTWVKEKGAKYDAKANIFTFVMKDHKGTEMPVSFAGMKPNNFEEAPSVVCVGKVEGGVFEASDIQTKCPSRYEGSGKMKGIPGSDAPASGAPASEAPASSSM